MGAGVEILVDGSGPLRRAAVLDDRGRLTDLHIDHAGRPSRLGAIYLGKVERIAAGLDAAFVALGEGPSGLLGLADIRVPESRPRKVGAALRGGQPVLVQVKADAVGDKGPTLTMDVTLAGRFLIHAPFGRGITVSRRLAHGPARAELTRRIAEVVVGSGWIVRAGAAEVAPEVLAAEAESLLLAWREVEAAAAATPPVRLRAGPDAARRALVEQGGRPVGRIAVADSALYEDIAAWCREAAPDLLPRLERYAGPPPLFETRDLDGEIARLCGRRVPLAGGGSLVIERTEALTVVDVNAGERGNALQVNLEAAAEIARQLRLRNVGGIVVVDFVNMGGRGGGRSDGERLLNALAAAVADDPVQTQVYGLSKLGLVEMTRARRGPALADLLAPGTASLED